MFRCYLELPNVLETSGDLPLEPEDIDNFSVLIIHACELLARAEVRFRIEGFDLPHLQDERLGQLSSDSDAVLSILLCEEELHDRSTLAIAESMDSWLIHAYVYEGNVVVIARAYEDASLTDITRIKVIGSAEYDAVFEVTYSYWSRTNGLAT